MRLTYGTLLGRYEILEKIGDGGMGEVYRARDPQLERDVAIKVLSERLAADQQALWRFDREAKAVAALSHPNILAMHDIGFEGNVKFVVTELLEGETLRHCLERSPLSWRKALVVGISIAEGVAAAHSSGVIHRDLKPENIFLARDGGVKVFDFGLARITIDKSAQDRSLALTETELGKVLGTVGYMSPEQIRGELVDATSDVFSLGCVLYEMVCGHRAFSHKTAAETQAAILRDDPPVTRLASDLIPEELVRIIVRCLKKEREARFPSARDLAAALNAVFDRQDSPFQVMIADDREDSLAVLPLVNVSDDPNVEYLSDGITENVINSLGQLRQLRVMARCTVFRYKGCEEDALQIGRDLNVRFVLTGSVLKKGDSLLISTELVEVSSGLLVWGEHYRRKIQDLFEVQEEIAREISFRLRIQLTGEQNQRLSKRYTESMKAYEHYLKGRQCWNQRTEEGLFKSIEHFERAIQFDPAYALAYAGLADGYNILPFWTNAPAKEALQNAKTAAAKALEIDDTIAEAYSSLGIILYRANWDWVASERAFRRAIELNPGYGMAHHWYSLSLAARGRFEEALAENRCAWQDDPLSHIINTARGWVLYLARRHDEAIQAYRKALELKIDFFPTQRLIGMPFMQKGMYDLAIKELQKALSLQPKDNFATGLLGHAYAMSGRKDKAAELRDTLLQKSTQEYVSPYDLAILYVGLDDCDQALTWLNRAYEDRAEWLSYAKAEPLLDCLRPDSRFHDIMKKMRLTG